MKGLLIAWAFALSAILLFILLGGLDVPLFVWSTFGSGG